ncbi:hypothetical protein C9374_001546 [Naegleria lovaniensis]|uniref:N-acetyltransferase domain-containing protein n=1 Tax=Naegleria lovaniensis TaxID=51637 RepID=A0AA88GWY4_NAELO|nr:uncharacterized protein C9374_001546 [Naegleria lovaniensis]KAG2387214.1 hypothetical protein C9374_001546 [Naegleria lovaniensis]
MIISSESTNTLPQSQPVVSILLKSTTQEIEACFSTFKELRTHLTTPQAFVEQVLEQQKEGYQIHAIENENHQVVACVGFRKMTTTAWGKIVYIDDLITSESCRGRGYGTLLLNHVLNFAKENGCSQIHLDSGYNRNTAHRVYLKFGFELGAHHFWMKVNK